MTKTELLKILAEFPDDINIFVASDEEGNRKIRLAAYGVILTDEPDAYDLDETSSFGDDDTGYIEELKEDGVDLDDYKPVLILYP